MVCFDDVFVGDVCEDGIVLVLCECCCLVL